MRIAAMIAAVLVTAASHAGAQTLTVRADAWCPYNCEPGSEKPGFMIEIAREALAPHGIAVDYDTLPWTRALLAAADGEIGAAVGANAADGEGLLLHARPFGRSETVFVVRRGETFPYARPEDLGGRSLAVIRDYSYGEVLDAFLEAASATPDRVQVASGETALLQNLRKLQAGRVDVVLEDRAVAQFAIAEGGLGDAFEFVESGKADLLFLALAPGREESPRIAGLLDAGIEELRRSGRLAEILARYGVADWEG